MKLGTEENIRSLLPASESSNYDGEAHDAVSNLGVSF
jgi:hypothetical protein